MRYAVHEGSKSFLPLFDVLWMNPTPGGTSFDAQDITIDTDVEYNLFIIIARDPKSGVVSITTKDFSSAVIYDPNLNSSLIAFSSELTKYSASDNKLFNRIFTITVNTEIPSGAITGYKFAFDNATEVTIGSSQSSTANGNCIPYAILGTKI